MLSLNPKELPQPKLHQYLLGAIGPRPIAFASTLDEQGRSNLAPYSFFNVFSSNPPILIFSPARRGRDNTTKHTLENALINRECVINIVNYPMVEQMSLASTEYPEGVSEFEKAGLTPIASSLVKPPRVKECKITMECEMVHHYKLENSKTGGATIVIGKIVLFHIDESVLLENYKINLETYKPIARLAGSNYSKLGEIFSIKR